MPSSPLTALRSPAAPVAAGPTELLVAGAGSAVALGVVIGSGPVVLVAGAVLLAVVAVRSLELFLLLALVARASLDQYRGDGLLSPATLLGAAVIVLVVVTEGLLRARGRAPRPLSTPFRVPLQVLVAASLLSALASDAVAASGVETLRLAGVLAMVIALERCTSSDGVARRVLLAVLLSSVFPLAVATQEVLTGQGVVIGGFSRVTGTFLHPNPLSIYLALLLVTVVALFPHVTSVAARWGMAVGGAVGAVCLLFTYTRASWIALLVGLLVVGAVQSRRLVLAVITGLLLVGLLVPSVSQRFADLGEGVTYSGATSNSLVWRVGYWNEVVGLAEDSPLLGIGLKGISRSTDDAKNAHNDPVRMYVETGLLGLGAYLALAASLVVTARRALRARTTGWRRGAAVAFAGVVAELAVVSLTSNVVTQVVLLWYVVALGVVATAVTTRPDPAAAPPPPPTVNAGRRT